MYAGGSIFTVFNLDWVKLWLFSFPSLSAARQRPQCMYAINFVPSQTLLICFTKPPSLVKATVVTYKVFPTPFYSRRLSDGATKIITRIRIVVN